jgi:hypothetical protein
MYSEETDLQYYSMMMRPEPVQFAISPSRIWCDTKGLALGYLKKLKRCRHLQGKWSRSNVGYLAVG